MAHYQPPSHLPNPNDPRNWPDPRIVAMEKDGLRTFGQTVNNSNIFNQDPRLTEMEQNRQRTLLQGTKYPISPSQFGEDYSVNTIQKFYPGKVRVVRKTLGHYYPDKQKNKNHKCCGCNNSKEEQHILLALPSEIIYIPVKVNIMKPLLESEEMIEKIEHMIKEANKILSQANIYLQYNVNFDLEFGVSDRVNDNGNIIFEQLTPRGNSESEGDQKYSKLREMAREELPDTNPPIYDDKKIIKKKGRKIAVFSSLGGNQDGFTHHKDNVIVLQNKNTFEESDEDGKSMGYSLAHEVCHTLTLGGGHKFAPQYGANPDGGKADPNGHINSGLSAYNRFDPDHTCNLMHIPRPTSDACPHPKLTSFQIKEIQQFAKDEKVGDVIEVGSGKTVPPNIYKKTSR